MNHEPPDQPPPRGADLHDRAHRPPHRLQWPPAREARRSPGHLRRRLAPTPRAARAAAPAPPADGVDVRRPRSHGRHQERRLCRGVAGPRPAAHRDDHGPPGQDQDAEGHGRPERLPPALDPRLDPDPLWVPARQARCHGRQGRSRDHREDGRQADDGLPLDRSQSQRRRLGTRRPLHGVRRLRADQPHPRRRREVPGAQRRRRRPLGSHPGALPAARQRRNLGMAPATPGADERRLERQVAASRAPWARTSTTPTVERGKPASTVLGGFFFYKAANSAVYSANSRSHFALPSSP